MLKIKIYSKLSLDEATIKKHIPNAIVAKPVKKDDLYQDIKNGIHIIGIIDGEFLQNFSVSPTEIRDALRCGLSVYGSSSMGAMRAAELHQFGMIGHGKIFEHIIGDPYFRDDKLGQVFYDELVHASIPYMDLYLSVEALVEKKLIKAAEAAQIIKIYERLHFSERNFQALAAKAKASPKNVDKLLESIKITKINFVSHKKLDGINMLKLINSHLKKIENMLPLIH